MIAICGCGDLGIEYFKKNCNGMEVAFLDHNSASIKSDILAGVPVYTFLQFKEIYSADWNIIIASSDWYDIYCTCVLMGFPVEGIYSGDDILSFEEMCEKKRTYFQNKNHIIYEHQLEQRINSSCDKFLKADKSLIGSLNRVSLMISNICNYAPIHKQCPASCEKSKEVLEMIYIESVITDLAKINFKGTLAFHIYNEPLIDPRLFYIIDYAHKKIPHMDILVYSNGFYFNKTIVDELVSLGVTVIKTTGYSIEEYRRMIKIDVPVAYSVLPEHLDSRMNLYDDLTPDSEKVNSKCRSFLSELCIYSNGDVGLCCLDYQHNHNLGNVKEKSLSRILSDELLIDLTEKLIKGKRTHGICRRCGWCR